MKIKGEKLAQLKSKVVKMSTGSGEPVDIELTALPPGFEERLRLLGIYEMPDPPKRPRTIGAAYVKDKSGQVIYDEDKSDPEYQRTVAAVLNRKSAIDLAEGLRKSVVEFETARPTADTKEAWCAYGDSLSAEIRAEGGFTDTEIYFLLGEIRKLANRLEVTEAMNNDFLDQ